MAEGRRALAGSRRLTFVDAGAWIALLDSTDRNAARAAAWFRADRGRRLITSNYVLDEAATRLRYDAGLPHALQLRDRVREAITLGKLGCIWVDEAVERDAWAILERYADIKLSFTDATTAVIARSQKIQAIFGFDRDFEALGFQLVPS